MANEQAAVVNYAEREFLRERVKKELIPTCAAIRDRRQPLEDAWASYHKTWTMEHEEQGYTGRSNIYLPAANKVVETIVSQLVAAAFPGDEFFSVEAEKSAWQKMAGDVRALEMQRVRSAKMRANAEAFYRQLVIKGNSPAHVHWVSKKKGGKLRKKSFDSAMDLLTQGPEKHEYTLFEGPMFSPIPAEDFYMWPENVTSPDDCSIAFRCASTTRAELLYAAKKFNRYLLEEVESLSESDRDDRKMQNDQARMLSQGYLSGETELGEIGRVDVVHCFLEMDVDAQTYTEEAEPICVCVTFTWSGHVLRIVEADTICPGRPHPFVLGRMGTIVGRLNGSGVIERVHPLQILLNDQMNQAMDCATYALNPIVLSNPDAVIGVLPDIEPGAQWLVHDVNQAVKFDRPPTDLIQAGSMLLTQTMSWMQDFAGAPPVLQGGATPGRAFKTATGIGTAQQNATLPLQQMVRLTETDVWEPTLQMFWRLDQRYATDEVLLEAGGTTLSDPRYFKPGDIYGDFKFRWLASTQAANQQVVAQQIQSIIQLLANPGIAQSLAQGPTPKRVDLAPLIDRYIRAMGLRDTERVLVDGASLPSDVVAGVDGPAQGQQQPQTPGLESLNGAQGQDPSGQFGAQRMDANQMAASFGQLGAGAGQQGQLVGPDGQEPQPSDFGLPHDFQA